MNKTRHACEEDDCYLDEYCPFKRSRCQEEAYEKLVVTSDHKLDPKKDSFKWCKGYGYNYMPIIETLLWHITGSSSTMNLQMNLM